MQTEKLLQEAIEKTRLIINQVEKLHKYDTDFLKQRETPTSWSILECIEHLNLYSDFYLPQIEQSILHAESKPEAEFKSGFLGNYFAQSMLPKKDMKKMKTFKDKNPLNSNLDIFVIDRFIHQQLEFINLLNQSRTVSLNKVKVKTSISKFIKIKLGDTFSFLINHNLRHLQQIEILKKNSPLPGKVIKIENSLQFQD